MIDKAIQN